VREEPPPYKAGRSALTKLIHGMEDSEGGETGMSFSIQKSVKIGSLRPTLSKSGLDASVIRGVAKNSKLRFGGSAMLRQCCLHAPRILHHHVMVWGIARMTNVREDPDRPDFVTCHADHPVPRGADNPQS